MGEYACSAHAVVFSTVPVISTVAILLMICAFTSVRHSTVSPSSESVKVNVSVEVILIKQPSMTDSVRLAVNMLLSSISLFWVPSGSRP